MIDEGFAINFGEAVKLEIRGSRAQSQSVSAADLEERRTRIQARGRRQSGKD